MKNRLLNPVVLLIGLILVVGLACGTSTPTPTPTNTPAPQQPSPQPPPTEPPQPVAQQYFTEEFDGDTSNWKTLITKGNQNADESRADIYTENGRLVLDLQGKNLNAYAYYEPYTYRDVRIDVRVENRGTNNNNINIICRMSDEGWYEFSIANNGLFWIWGFEPDKGYRKLYDGGSNKIKAGKEVNEFTVICKEKTLSLYINGIETRTIQENDLVFRDGMVAVGVSSFADLPVTVEYDWVTISEP
ncbi:MAG: hypothetical protein GXP40_06565 [Chloroflexi bacterium]|nr:hypothetical protein [Chloroflexota bacterium]